MSLQKLKGNYKGVYVNKLKNGDISYYINYRDENGDSVKKFVGKKTEESDFNADDAKRKLIEIKHRLNTGEEVKKKKPRKSTNRLDDCFNDYLAHIKTYKTTWNDDESRYRNHIRPVFGRKDIATITFQDIDKLKIALLEKRSPQTVKNTLAVLRQIFNYTIKYKKIKNLLYPFGKQGTSMPKTDNERQGYLSHEQARVLLKELKKLPNKDIYDLTVVLLFTGARFDEVADLRWQNVNFKTGMIYFGVTKEGNPRKIKMARPLIEALRDRKTEMCGQTSLIFKNRNGKKYSAMPTSWQEVVDNLIEDNVVAGKYRITTHSLRHTHASWLAEKGLDIIHIKEQLGHKTIQMTLRYSHLLPNKRHDFTLQMADWVDSDESS